MSDERLCVTCPVLAPSREPRYVERGNVCEGDRLYLADLLAEIPGLVAQTTDKIHPERVSGEKVSGSRELPAPVNLTALGVTQPPYVRGPRTNGSLDVRGAIDDQLGIPQPVVILDQWITDWIDYRGQHEHPPATDLDAIVGWLRNRLDWACDEHPAIEEFAREIKDIVRKLRGIVQEVEKGTFFGYCPKKLRDGTRCNKRLYVDVYLTDLIKCHRVKGGCGAEWNRRAGQWVTFRDEQDRWNEEAEVITDEERWEIRQEWGEEIAKVLRAVDVEEAVEMVAAELRRSGTQISNGELLVRLVHDLADRIALLPMTMRDGWNEEAA